MPSNWQRRRQNQHFYPHSMRYGTRVGGMAIAFQCIIVISFLGFGLTLMGTIMTVTSYNDPLDDKPFFAKHKNPIKIIGPIFLGIGLFFILFSIILCILSVKTGRKLLQQERSAQPVPTNINTYPSPQRPYPTQPYPPQQPVPPQGSYQPYPPQQPVPPPPQGSYQPYPPQQPIQTDVNINPSTKGNYPPYPPQPGYQYVPNEPADLPPPYPISGKDASAPYTPPSYPAQPAYNPSAS